MAVIDDDRRDQGGVRQPASARRVRAARAGRPFALGGGLDRRHERHASGHDSAPVVVRRRGLARARADADAGDHRPPRGGDPRVQARAVLARRRAVRAHRRRCGPALRRPLSRRRPAAAQDRRGGGGDRHRRSRPAGRDHQARDVDQEGARAAPLRPHFTSARGQHALRLLGPAHAGGRAAAVRGAQGAHLPAYELALPARRHRGRAQADREQRRLARRVCEGRGLRHRARRAPARARGQRRQGHRPPRDHPDQRRASRRQDERRRPADLRHGRAALPRRLPPRRGVREHAAGDHGGRAHLPHPRPRAGRPGLARRLRRGPRDALTKTTTRATISSSPSSSAARTC